MKIAVVSDTHRINKYIDIAKKYIKECDAVIHLGDNIEDVDRLTEGFKGLVYSVKGNCDFSSKYPSEQVVDVEGKKIFITHGHNYGVKYSMNNIYYRAKELEVDIALFGHTHESLIIEEDGVVLMNPGSISLPRNSFRSIGYIEIGEKVDLYLKKIDE